MIATLFTLFLLAQLDETPLTASLSQRAPLSLEITNAEVQPAEVVVPGVVTSDTEEEMAALAVGWLLIDPFDDLVTVSYSREYSALDSGDSAKVTANITDARADEVVRVVGFVYAVRFADGELWKADLSVVAVELLEDYGVALPPTRLQP